MFDVVDDLTLSIDWSRLMRAEQSNRQIDMVANAGDDRGGRDGHAIRTTERGKRGDDLGARCGDKCARNHHQFKHLHRRRWCNRLIASAGGRLAGSLYGTDMLESSSRRWWRNPVT